MIRFQKYLPPLSAIGKWHKQNLLLLAQKIKNSLFLLRNILDHLAAPPKSPYKILSNRNYTHPHLSLWEFIPQQLKFCSLSRSAFNDLLLVRNFQPAVTHSYFRSIGNLTAKISLRTFTFYLQAGKLFILLPNRYPQLICFNLAMNL